MKGVAVGENKGDWAFRRIVVKLGTNVLTEGTDHLSRPRVLDLVRQVVYLHGQGLELIVVTSGAIMAGREILGPSRGDKSIPRKQVFAAIGQGRLMHLYEQLFELYDINVAQVLLTREDMGDRERYLNARNTFLALLQRRVIPIVNENDVVAVEEIKFGDNDNLSAMVVNLVDADLLALLTDTEGLYTTDPHLDEKAVLISEVPAIDEEIWRLAGRAADEMGTGGMVTKIQAAELATRSGATVVIVRGSEKDVIIRLAAGEAIGTRFLPTASKMESRKRWILAESALMGELQVDEGAAKALKYEGKSLLPVGVVAVLGDFNRGASVRILDPGGKEIARGIVRYGAADLERIKGMHSEKIEEVLGYDYGDEVVHRDDLVGF